MEISDCQDTDARNTNRKFSNRKPLYMENLSMPTLIDETKPVVLVKYVFECREEIKLKYFPRKFLTESKRVKQWFLS